MLKLKDLDSKTASNAGAWIDIFHPVTKENTGMQILVAGTDSDRYRSVLHAHQNRRVQAFSRGQPLRLSAEEQENERLDLLVSCTLGWKGVSEDGSTPLEFSPENARRVYVDFPAIREQVDMAIADRSLFMKA